MYIVIVSKCLSFKLCLVYCDVYVCSNWFFIELLFVVEIIDLIKVEYN